MESFGHWQILLKILLRSKQDSSERNQLLLFSAAAASSMRAFLLGFSTFCDGGKEKKLVPPQLQSNGVMLVRSVGKNVKYCQSFISHSGGEHHLRNLQPSIFSSSTTHVFSGAVPKWRRCATSAPHRRRGVVKLISSGTKNSLQTVFTTWLYLRLMMLEEYWCWRKKFLHAFLSSRGTR